MADRVDSKLKGKIGWRDVLRFFLAFLGLFFCYRLIGDAATSGVSRLLTTSAILQSKIAPADLAVRLAPRDPEAHYTRGLTLVNLEQLNDAVAELRQATELRPHHYYEWLDLGVTLDRLGDQTGAMAAISESIRLAPNFAQPHWQLGNLFFRQGRYQEAFAELRLGARGNPNLYEGMLALAWVAAEGSVVTVEALVQPQSGRNHLELARFLTKQGKGADAARHVIEAGTPQGGSDLALLHETIAQLIAAQQYSDAYVAWAASHTQSGSNGKQNQVFDGNFVGPIIPDDPGFGWQLTAVPTVVASIDPSGPDPNARSLRLEFGGDSVPGIQLVRQMILLQPNSRYSLTFVSKSEELVTGGPPVIFALSANSKSPKVLGQSEALSTGTRGWTTYKLDFSSDENSSAVVLALQRLACNQSPCPVFGRLWLSGFLLTKI